MSDRAMPPNCGEKLKKFLLPICWTFFLVTLDVLVYGWILPIVGTYIAGCISNVLKMSPCLEVLMVIFTVFSLLLFTFQLRVEGKFWSHFFAHDDGFKPVLQLRDFINFCTIVYSFNSVFNSLTAIIADQEMKKQYLGEGLGLAVVRPFLDEKTFEEKWLKSCACDLEPVIEEVAGKENQFYDKFLIHIYAMARYVGFTNAGMVVKAVCKEQVLRDRFIHGAEFIFAVARLTAGVTKVIYFNTLYAYLRAMDIFVNMQMDGDDDEDDYSVLDPSDYGDKDEQVQLGRTNTAYPPRTVSNAKYAKQASYGYS